MIRLSIFRVQAFLLVTLFAFSVAAQEKEACSGPAQPKRGCELFFKAPTGEPCGSCHLMGGRGTAVGPDLKAIARLSPAGLVTAIRSTRTQYAVNVKTKTGESFPAMKVKEDTNTAEIYDLSKTPPELRKLDRADIDSITDNMTWKHPPASQEYTSEQLADIIAYIKWIGYRSTSEIKPSDIP
jgi:mono/diheme cytochrome c family protein